MPGPGGELHYPGLQGKFALITGASRRAGIGAATCLALARRGANILFTGWTAYDREQPHGSGEAEAARLEDDLSAMGVQARYAETWRIRTARPVSWMPHNSGWACRTFW